MNKLIVNQKKYTFFGLEFKQVKDMAEYFGVSSAFASAVLSGKKPPTKAMLDTVGYTKTVTTTTEYNKKEGE